VTTSIVFAAVARTCHETQIRVWILIEVDRDIHMGEALSTLKHLLAGDIFYLMDYLQAEYPSIAEALEEDARHWDPEKPIEKTLLVYSWCAGPDAVPPTQTEEESRQGARNLNEAYAAIRRYFNI